MCSNGFNLKDEVCLQHDRCYKTRMKVVGIGLDPPKQWGEDLGVPATNCAQYVACSWFMNPKDPTTHKVTVLPACWLKRICAAPDPTTTPNMDG